MVQGIKEVRPKPEVMRLVVKGAYKRGMGWYVGKSLLCLGNKEVRLLGVELWKMNWRLDRSTGR